MSRMRTVGIGALGALGGLLAGLVVQDVIATVLVSAAGRSAAATILGAVSTALLLCCTVVGALVAAWGDRRAAEARDRRPHRSDRSRPSR